MHQKKSITLILASAIVISLLSFFTESAYAAYLVNEPFTVTQPDGTELSLFATGDEYYRRVYDQDGYTVVQDPKTGYFVYADLIDDNLVPTSFVVGKVDPLTTSLTPNLALPPRKIG